MTAPEAYHRARITSKKIHDHTYCAADQLAADAIEGADAALRKARFSAEANADTVYAAAQALP